MRLPVWLCLLVWLVQASCRSSELVADLSQLAADISTLEQMSNPLSAERLRWRVDDTITKALMSPLGVRVKTAKTDADKKAEKEKQATEATATQAVAEIDLKEKEEKEKKEREEKAKQERGSGTEMFGKEWVLKEGKWVLEDKLMVQKEEELKSEATTGGPYKKEECDKAADKVMDQLKPPPSPPPPPPQKNPDPPPQAPKPTYQGVGDDPQATMDTYMNAKPVTKTLTYADTFVPSTTEPKHPSNDIAAMPKTGEMEPLWPYKGQILNKKYHWRGKQTQGGKEETDKLIHDKHRGDVSQEVSPDMSGAAGDQTTEMLHHTKEIHDFDACVKQGVSNGDDSYTAMQSEAYKAVHRCDCCYRMMCKSSCTVCENNFKNNDNEWWKCLIPGMNGEQDEDGCKWDDDRGVCGPKERDYGSRMIGGPVS